MKTKYTEGLVGFKHSCCNTCSYYKTNQEMSLQAFAAADVRGIARVDFFHEEATEKFYISEINTMPGFTANQYVSSLWAATGVPFAELVNQH
jgi:D-alanine-D-alanine ligase